MSSATGCATTSRTTGAARKFVIHDQAGVDDLRRFIAEMRLAGQRMTVTVQWGAKRSVPQNSLVYALYGTIARQLDGESVTDIRRECKLDFGCPILRADNAEFREIYDAIIAPLDDREMQLRTMDWFQVTSRMNKAQCTAFINEVIREYTARGLWLAPEDYAA